MTTTRRNLWLLLRMSAVPIAVAAGFVGFGFPYLNVRVADEVSHSGVIATAGFAPPVGADFSQGLSTREVVLVRLGDGRVVQADTLARAVLIGEKVQVRQYHRLLTRGVEYQID